MGSEFKLSKANVEDIIGLSPMQQGILFHYLSDEQSGLYFEQLSLTLSGDIEPELIHKSWYYVMNNNTALRTVFNWEKTENPIQIILKHYEPCFEYLDLTLPSIRNKMGALKDIKERDLARKLDIRTEPYRLTLCKLEEDQAEFIISNHHILYDGWSNGIILREFMYAYHSYSNGAIPKITTKSSYKNYLKLIADKNKSNPLLFWNNYLHEYEMTDLLPVNPSANLSSAIKQVQQYAYPISNEISVKMNQFIKENEITLATLLYFAWGILLQKYNDTGDVVFGTTVSGRNVDIDGIDNAVGLFINTIPLRIKNNCNSSLKSMLKDLYAQLIERQRYDSVPLIDIKASVAKGNSSALFDSIVTIENYPIDVDVFNQSNALTILDYSLKEMTNFHLGLEITTLHKVDLNFFYNPDIFQYERIQMMCGHYMQIIAQILEFPQKLLNQIEIITLNEKNRILNEFNNTRVSYPLHKTINELFEEQVKRNPDNVAVLFKEKKMTYHELNSEANILARILSNDIGPNKIAAILTHRSMDMIVAILGVLKSGAAYLPIDPNYPEERIRYMLQDSGAELLLTTSDTKHLADRCFAKTLVIDELCIQDVSCANLKHINKADDLAYVIYTSGSTGHPKGSMIEHRSIVNRLLWMQKEFPIDSNDIILQKTPYTFDVSVWELLWWSLTGAKVCILEPGMEKDPEAIADAVYSQGITTIHFVPSMLRLFLEYIEEHVCVSRLASLRLVFASGESINKYHVSKFNALFNEHTVSSKLINLYGPTEATVDVAYFNCTQVKDMDTIPIGKPIDNIKLYILDQEQQMIPAGVRGELYISGVGVSRGYLNRPELTAKSFIDDPFDPGSRMYKTNDMAYYNQDGNIEFVGRLDNQVKIRGQRVELGEIEASLMKYPRVRDVLVLEKGVQENKYLCAYILSDDCLDPDDIKAHLMKQLPEYMIPLHYIGMREFPTNDNGKLDRRKLPEPITASSNQTVEQLDIHNEIQSELLNMWESLLGREINSLDRNFFDIGGNSLLVIKMQFKINKIYPDMVKVTDIFAHPTIRKLSEYIITNIDSNKASDTVKIHQSLEDSNNDICIIGMDVILGGAQDADEYWDNIVSGKDCIREIPDHRKKDSSKYFAYISKPGMKEDYIQSAYLERVDAFDYPFFHLSPKEASLMDPNQRLLLESAWRTIEDAGYGGSKLRGSKTGVYIGFSNDMIYDYKRLICEAEPEMTAIAVPGNLSSIISSRISYYMDLKGPSMVIDTACSSSLVAVHTACKAINGGECEMAIAGGIKINLLPLVKQEKMGIESSDSRTKAFNDKSDGTGDGEGVGAVLLKPLNRAVADGDHIYAVIKGTAINQDGNSIGITAPNVLAQEEVLERAWTDAQIDPATLSYIEAHGTGTKLGDPIEVEAITRAFKKYTDKKQFCAISTVKSNIGHLDAAAGIAGLIKAALALRRKKLPPLVHFNRPNSIIKFEESAVHVLDQARDWEASADKRRCGVSSFGMSGTNCHIVLEEAPEVAFKEEVPGGNQLLVLSAKSKDALLQSAQHLLKRINRNELFSLNNICYTLATGRAHYYFRLAIAATDVHDLKKKLSGIVMCGMESLREEWFFYGVHEPSVVSMISDYSIDGKPLNLKEHAAQIGELYIQGSDLNWDALYADMQVTRESLPAYPFERLRCWIETDTGKDKLDSMFFNTAWREEELEGILPEAQIPGGVLFIKDERGLTDTLEEHFLREKRDVMVLELGRKYEYINENRVVTDATLEGYIHALKEFKNRNISLIIHTASLSIQQDIEDVQDIYLLLEHSVYSLFFLIKAMFMNEMNNPVDLVLISEYTDAVTDHEELIKSVNKSLFGLAKVVPQEHSNIRCKLIDTDDKTDYQLILSEIHSGDWSYPVAYRDGKRYIEELDCTPSPGKRNGNMDVKRDGTYIVTGGLGGIGLIIGNHLASKQKVRLIIIGRSEFIPKDQWNTSTLDKLTGTTSYQQLESIIRIQNQGSYVYYYQGDVSDEMNMLSLLGDIRQEHGRINGIIHCAGTAGRSFIVQEELQTLKEALAPKVMGTWVLDKLTREDQLDFFILFSAAASLTGAPAHGSYTAANAFLDAYCSYRNKHAPGTLTINWGIWDGTGMSAEYGEGPLLNTLVRRTPPAQMLQAFDKAMNTGLHRTIIGDLDVQGSLGSRSIAGLIRLAPRLLSTLGSERQVPALADNTDNNRATGKIRNGNYTYFDIEREVASIWQKVLGIKDLKLDDNFFEIGGNSVLITKVLSLIQASITDRLSVSDLFMYPTIARLSEYIAYLDKGKGFTEGKDTGYENEEDELIALLSEVRKGKIAVGNALDNYLNL